MSPVWVTFLVGKNSHIRENDSIFSILPLLFVIELFLLPFWADLQHYSSSYLPAQAKHCASSPIRMHQAPVGQQLSGPAVDRLAFLLELYQEFLYPSLPECMFPIMWNSLGEVNFFLNWLNKNVVFGKAPPLLYEKVPVEWKECSPANSPGWIPSKSAVAFHTAGFLFYALFSSICKTGVSDVEKWTSVIIVSWVRGWRQEGRCAPNTRLCVSKTTWKCSARRGRP